MQIRLCNGFFVYRVGQGQLGLQAAQVLYLQGEKLVWVIGVVCLLAALPDQLSVSAGN